MIVEATLRDNTAMKLTVLAAAILAGSTAFAAAQTATPGIDKRQANQQQRIDKGVESGQLNAKEAARLQKGQATVQKMEDKAKSDGKVTKAERAKIHATQDRQSARIAKQKHDGQTAK
jgi:Trk K+ transport system NAD-binding subunit